MTSIIIYTKKEVAEEKRKSKYEVLYWTFSSRPKQFEDGDACGDDKVFFAYDGAIRGVFEATGQLYVGKEIPDNAVKFSRRSYKALPKPIPAKPFQGFKYADKVPGLEEIAKRLSK